MERYGTTATTVLTMAQLRCTGIRLMQTLVLNNATQLSRSDLETVPEV